ncbi:hypothetical protein [Branchiibius cervicis]|uniref:Sugar ABC transporter permease n=1 Tax=Branchiibius cervicis TaxID=908252 RepID=A0ABW2AUF7_9MICO
MRRTTRRPWLLLAAPLLVIAALLLYPIYRVIYLSFHAYGLKEIISGVPRWVGLENYRQVFSGSPACRRTTCGASSCPTPLSSR